MERKDGVAIVRFESGSKKNAITQQLRDLISVARELELDTQLQAIVLTGTRESFSAGIDTHEVMTDLVARRHEITPLERRMKRVGAWDVRIADPHRGFEYAPKGRHPLELMPDCKSVVAFVVPRAFS